MYRYIFLIRDEFKTGQLAINSRVFEKSYKTINKKLAFLIGNVLIRSIDRAESVYRSMESRGFDGNFYIIEKDSKIEAVNIISLCIFILMPLSVKLIELVNII
jgi:cobalt/nickel transport system permease protein